MFVRRSDEHSIYLVGRVTYGFDLVDVIEGVIFEGQLHEIALHELTIGWNTCRAREKG